MTTDRPPAPRPSRGRVLWLVVSQVGDFAISLASYYVLRWLGASVWLALIIPSLVTLALLLLRWARRRTIDPLSVLLLAVLVVSIVISVWSGSPRFLLAKGAIFTAAAGVAFLVSIGLRRPLTFILARALVQRMPVPSRDWDQVWTAERRFRTAWRVSSVYWGIAMLADAVGIVLLAYRLPIDSVPAMITVLRIVTFVVVQLVTNIDLSLRGVWRMLEFDPFGARRRRVHAAGQ